MDQRMDDSVGGMEGSLDKDLSSLPSAIGKPERERERETVEDQSILGVSGFLSSVR
jgi:hypothetical protein